MKNAVRSSFGIQVRARLDQMLRQIHRLLILGQRKQRVRRGRLYFRRPRVVGKQHRELDLRIDLHALPQLTIGGPDAFQYLVQSEDRRIPRLVRARVVRMFVYDALIRGDGTRRLTGFGINLTEQEQIVRDRGIGRERRHELLVVVGRLQIVAAALLVCASLCVSFDNSVRYSFRIGT